MKKNTTISMLLFAALALFTVPANAAKQVNDTSEINLTVFVPCAAGGAGELVDLSGPLHTFITFTINGNNVSGSAHFQPQGLSGTGGSSGDKYQASGVRKGSRFKVSFHNGQFASMFVRYIRF